MARRASDNDLSGKKPCAFCRTVRVVVIFTIILVALMAYANKLEWLNNIDFTSLFGYLVLVFFITILAYRLWDEYGRAKPSLADKKAKRAEREKLFDELDAKEVLEAHQLQHTQEAQQAQLEALDVSVGVNVEANIEESAETGLEPSEGVDARQLSHTPEQLDLLKNSD